MDLKLALSVSGITAARKSGSRIVRVTESTIPSSPVGSVVATINNIDVAELTNAQITNLLSCANSTVTYATKERILPTPGKCK